MPTKYKKNKKRNKTSKFNGPIQSRFGPLLYKRFIEECNQRGYSEAEHVRRGFRKLFQLVDEGKINDY